MKRAIVIGAGVGGLASAIELARRGLEVTVLEASQRPGGKAGIVELDGVEVDTGPSVLTLPRIFGQVFETAGTRLEDEVELLSPSPAFRYVYPDGVVLDVHHRLEETLDKVDRALGTKARDELVSFMAYAERIWNASADTFVFGDAPGLHSVVKFGFKGIGQLLDIDASRSMARAIEDRIRSPHLRDLLLRYATYNGSDPRRAPATLNCIAHVELALGGYGVKGGIHELARALARIAEQVGAEIRYGEPVTEIVVTGKRATGVRVGTSTLLADAVVANADPEHVFRHLLPDRMGDALRSGAVPSTSGWTAIVRAPRDAARAPHTVLFPEAYGEEFADLFDRDRPPETPTVYLCDQEATHQRKGWSDASPLFVMANAPAEPEDGPRDSSVWSALEERVLERLQSAGITTSEAPFLWTRTPSGLAEAFPGSRGALYGAASNSTFSAFKRPPNRLPKPRGLYLASGGAHPGGGLPLCASSGRAAARAVLDDLGVPS
ncbi:MAG: phytoene desaturase family protein [Myxococcota bacterium]